MILYGKVFGAAGTDNLRVKVGLLWGLPVALSVGIIGALATTILSVIIAAIAAWFEGWVNGLIQRVSEISMIIPNFALALTIFYMVSNSIWVTFAAIILLMIFGNAVKTYYAAFQLALQSSYIESARAYGASDWRIIWRYMVPPILPLVIPQLPLCIVLRFLRNLFGIRGSHGSGFANLGENRPRCAVCRSVLWIQLLGYTADRSNIDHGIGFHHAGRRFEYCPQPEGRNLLDTRRNF